jgi:hypothetical protein
MKFSLTPAGRWVAKLDGYEPKARVELRERCIGDAQREVIEVVLNLLREAGERPLERWQ